MNAQIQFLCLLFAIFILCDGIEAKEEYTEKELTAIKKFRERMGNALYREYMKSDPYLIRWLQAAKFDPTPAAEKLTKTLKWRKEQNIDEILNETIWEFKTPVYYHAGLDPKGGLVTIFRMGPIDLRNHLLNQRHQAAIRFWHQFLESTEIRIMRNLGVWGNSSMEGAIVKGVGIWDGAGFNLRQHGCLACLPVFVQMVRDFVDHYPGYARTIVALNVPRAAAPFIDLVKPILDNQFDEGIKIFDTDRAKWMKYIRQLLGPEKLGAHLGGTRNLTNEEEREYLKGLNKISQQSTKN